MDIIIGVFGSLVATIIWVVLTQFYDFNAKRKISMLLDLLYDCVDSFDSAITFSNYTVAEMQSDKILGYCKEIFDNIRPLTYLPMKRKLFCTILYNAYYTVSYYKRVWAGYGGEQELEKKLQKFKRKYYYKVNIYNADLENIDEHSFLVVSITILQALNEQVSVKRALQDNFYVNRHCSRHKDTYMGLIAVNNFKIKGTHKYDLRNQCFTQGEYIKFISKKFN